MMGTKKVDAKDNRKWQLSEELEGLFSGGLLSGLIEIEDKSSDELNNRSSIFCCCCWNHDYSFTMMVGMEEMTNQLINGTRGT